MAVLRMRSGGIQDLLDYYHQFQNVAPAGAACTVVTGVGGALGVQVVLIGAGVIAQPYVITLLLVETVDYGVSGDHYEIHLYRAGGVTQFAHTHCPVCVDDTDIAGGHYGQINRFIGFHSPKLAAGEDVRVAAASNNLVAVDLNVAVMYRAVSP